MPMASGKSVNDARFRSMLPGGSRAISLVSMNVRSARSISSGIVNTVTTLVTAESVTHSGTSARAANVYAFEVTPLGQAASITRPTAMAAGAPKTKASRKAASGRPTSCATRPIAAAFGKTMTRLKSASVSDSPSPTMTRRSTHGMTRALMNSACAPSASRSSMSKSFPLESNRRLPARSSSFALSSARSESARACFATDAAIRGRRRRQGAQ